MIHLITKKTPKPGSNFFSGSSSTVLETVILEAVIAFTHDLFALDIETCKHVSASLGSAVILDRREGNHNFSFCSCGGDPYCSNQNWNCPASGCFKRMYNKARALGCGGLGNVIGSDQLTSSALSFRSTRRGRCSYHSRDGP